MCGVVRGEVLMTEQPPPPPDARLQKLKRSPHVLGTNVEREPRRCSRCAWSTEKFGRAKWCARCGVRPCRVELARRRPSISRKSGCFLETACALSKNLGRDETFYSSYPNQTVNKLDLA
ncbi:hypothetical protein OAD67_02865 [bacterium]|nr:hypothetical protein [bacterium]